MQAFWDYIFDELCL